MGGKHKNKKKEDSSDDDNEKRKFVAPSQHTCSEAIGIAWKKDNKTNERKYSIKYSEWYKGGNMSSLRPFLDPSTFDPVDPPAEGDWLDEFPERGQAFLSFASTLAKKPSDEQDTIYIIPMGELDETFCKTLHRYALLFFCMRVQMLDSVNIQDNKKVKRRSVPYSDPGTQPKQFLTKDLLSLIARIKPPCGFCAVGITMEDLYPREEWNFVFGEATDKGTGIFSFARYGPPFADGTDKTLLLARSMKVMVHEIGHIFGLDHCIYYKCIMNGSNGIEEEDKCPFHLCPVCLRKLHFSIGFDIYQRYKDLQTFYKEFGFTADAEWVQQWIDKGPTEAEQAKEKQKEKEGRGGEERGRDSRTEKAEAKEERRQKGREEAERRKKERKKKSNDAEY